MHRTKRYQSVINVTNRTGSFPNVLIGSQQDLVFCLNIMAVMAARSTSSLGPALLHVLTQFFKSITVVDYCNHVPSVLSVLLSVCKVFCFELYGCCLVQPSKVRHLLNPQEEDLKNYGALRWRSKELRFAKTARLKVVY